MDEWTRRNTEHLRPQDRELVRGYDPTTAGLVMLQVNYLRALAKALFPGYEVPR